MPAALRLDSALLIPERTKRVCLVNVVALLCNTGSLLPSKISQILLGMLNLAVSGLISECLFKIF